MPECNCGSNATNPNPSCRSCCDSCGLSGFYPICPDCQDRLCPECGSCYFICECDNNPWDPGAKNRLTGGSYWKSWDWLRVRELYRNAGYPIKKDK